MPHTGVDGQLGIATVAVDALHHTATGVPSCGEADM